MKLGDQGVELFNWFYSKGCAHTSAQQERKQDGVSLREPHATSPWGSRTPEGIPWAQEDMPVLRSLCTQTASYKEPVVHKLGVTH